MAERILIVDDERLTRETLVERLRDEGFDAHASSGPYEALEAMAEHPAHLVVTDLRMPSMDGTELHARIKEQYPETAVIFITAFGTVSSAVEAMQRGAEDYLTKPLNTDELVIRIRRILQRQRDREEIRRLRAETAHRHQFGDLVYRSAAMNDVVASALAVADTDVTVLVEGPTGTGKEVLCRAIHAHSLRASGPFVAVNCAGLNPNLVESELFGHEPGAFTGATRLRKGRLEIAHGGTLLIDEVDDLSPENQVRLLRFLQDRSFERVGSSRTRHADVRVLCATKRDLRALVEKGAFREDLFYRINTVVIKLPPLRDRRDDIPELVEHFVRKAGGAAGADEGVRFSEDAMRDLLGYEWPGNVRELQHVVEHATAFVRHGVVGPEHLPEQIRAGGTPGLVELRLPAAGTISLSELLRTCEERAVDWALTRAGGNQGRAAELLSIPRTTLRSRLQALREQEDAAEDA